VALPNCLTMTAEFPAPAVAMADVPSPVWGASEVLEIIARILNERSSPALIVAPPVS